MSKKNVLFLCTHNAARSQMAEGLLRKLYGQCYTVKSAGIHPTQVHPLAIQVMKEIGIDISNHRSKSIDEFQGISFDVVVTVCDYAKETCPFFPGKSILHRGFFDPTSYQEFQQVRDEIKQWIVENFHVKNGKSTRN
ncbi:MAG: arsenate reductase ArsC [Candidatus Thermoplasmatota archaeon]|nr:arsenate reductase ArsC [Candidatus Thermoplasmatota archaeon]